MAETEDDNKPEELTPEETEALEHAEEAEGLNFEQHHPQEHTADDSHGQGDREQAPPGAARQVALVLLQPRQQGQQRHQQQSQLRLQ